MAYIRTKTREGKEGVLTYYYLVEGKRIDGKVKQKIIKYLGKNPNTVTVELDEKQTKDLVKDVFLAGITVQEELKSKLKQLEIPAPDQDIIEMNLTHKIGGKKFIFRLFGQTPNEV